MKRDLGNEFIVAIATVGVIAFALVFGILITLSSNPKPVLTPVSTTAVVIVATSTTTQTVGASNTPTNIPSTATNTLTTTVEVPSPTATLTATSESTHTPTEEPPTATAEPASPTATSAPTDEPTFTPTEEPSATNTPTRIKPTERTVEIKQTPVHPTFTLTPTIIRPSSTPTPKPPTYTYTPLPSATNTTAPTSTLTATRTSTSTSTSTLTPTVTASFTPTRTPSMTPTRLTITLTPYMTATSGIVPTPAATATPSCTRPAGWSVYIVEPGNTLLNIAIAVRSTIKELSEVNCLTDADHILTGDALYVPRLPTEPISTAGPSASSLGCSDPSIAAITSPTARQHVSGTFNLRGTAAIADFWYYKTEIRPPASSVYNFYSQSETPVIKGELARIDTSIFGKGLSWIRVVVVKKDASVPPTAVCIVPVYFD